MWNVFKVDDKNTITISVTWQSQLTFTCSNSTIETLGKRCKICSKFTVKTLERRCWCRSSVFVVNFEHISHLFLAFLSMTLSK